MDYEETASLIDQRIAEAFERFFRALKDTEEWDTYQAAREVADWFRTP